MIIGITGYARHGKDSIADFICKKNKSFKKYALADPMKDVCCQVFNWTRDYVEKYKDIIDPMWGISPRRALQTLGTEWGQHILGECDNFSVVTGRCLWANLFKIKVKNNPQQNWVVSDVRFHHEVAVIRGLGGHIVKVNRPSIAPDLSHTSEQDIAEIMSDYYIENNGTLKDLQRATDKMLIYFAKEYWV